MASEGTNEPQPLTAAYSPRIPLQGRGCVFWWIVSWLVGVPRCCVSLCSNWVGVLVRVRPRTINVCCWMLQCLDRWFAIEGRRKTDQFCRTVHTVVGYLMSLICSVFENKRSLRSRLHSALWRFRKRPALHKQSHARGAVFNFQHFCTGKLERNALLNQQTHFLYTLFCGCLSFH